MVNSKPSILRVATKYILNRPDELQTKPECQMRVSRGCHSFIQSFLILLCVQTGLHHVRQYLIKLGSGLILIF